MNKAELKEKIEGMSEQDKVRLCQCICCKHNPYRCGCGEKDEDKNGLCKHFIVDTPFIPKEEKQDEIND